MNFLKKNKLYIIIFIVVFFSFIFFDNEVETNNEIIEESFNWSRAITLWILAGCSGLLHHFFIDKNK
tara:strand:- start:14 stop:214 length:201 start_codon:yes stop_codon:yes gene_type:complete